MSIPGQDTRWPLGDPNYGGQLNPAGISVFRVKARPRGHLYRRARHVPMVSRTHFDDPRMRSATSRTRPALAGHRWVCSRVAPAMIGLGLLQAISEDTLLLDGRQERQRSATASQVE
ncbi:MAG: hypothetical protein U0165_00010 [Polyangiaceae bacterium]